MSRERAALQRSAPPASPFGRGPMGGFGMPVQKARDFTGTLRRLTGYMRPHRTALAVVVVAGVLSTLFSVLAPKLIGVATTRIFEGYIGRRLGAPNAGVDFVAVGGIVQTLLLLYVTSALFQYLQQYLMSGVAQRTVYALRQDVEAKFSRLPLRFFDSRTHGEVLSRAVNDLDNISSTLQQNLTQLITSVLTVLGIIVMMLTISRVLTAVVVLTLPLSVLIVTRIARRSQGYFVRQQKALGELNGHVAEMYAGHAIVTAFGHEGRAIARFADLNQEYHAGAWRAQFVTGALFPITMFVGNLGYVAVAVIGGYMVTSRAIAIGDVQAFIQYSRQFTMPISQLSSIANTVQLTVASAERVFELLDEDEEPADATRAAVPTPPRGDVRFEQVAFSYAPESPLIEEMNLVVAPGQTVAIVGPTGAGKTTMVNLMRRFYDVNAGAIRVDGIDIRDLGRGDLRRMFGMVLRAFLADPAILILDEATSSVDTRTEVLIQEAMAELMRGRTTFVIAHRLSTIRNADVILMMEHGRIVETGSHETLLAAGGRYAALYQSQFAGRTAAAATTELPMAAG